MTFYITDLDGVKSDVVLDMLSATLGISRCSDTGEGNYTQRQGYCKDADVPTNLERGNFHNFSPIKGSLGVDLACSPYGTKVNCNRIWEQKTADS
jgi:hypothetical protein